MSNQIFTNPFGAFSLERLPKSQKGDLRAWDAADELLLNHLAEEHSELLDSENQNILIINDAFGAVCVALSNYATDSWSDSFVSHIATQENLRKNALPPSVNTITSPQTLTKTYSLVIIKIPKTLSLLEDQLHRLKPFINEDTVLLSSAMSKHIHTSTLKLFEKIIGTTTTSRATKKARLVFSINNQKVILENPYPKTLIEESLKLDLINHANVFSNERLDIGSRFLISQLHHCPTVESVIDLGCGNGVLGIMLKRLQPEAKVSFVDESYFALESAKTNCQKEGFSTDDTQFISSDCLSQYQENQVDLILCNPPFHQAYSMGDQIAWKMLKQSLKHLNKGGELWVIGNRHLAYHTKLKQIFGNCRTVDGNKKFVVLAAKKH